MIYNAKFTNKDRDRYKNLTSLSLSNKSKIIIFLFYLIFLGLFIYFYKPILNPIYKESYLFIFLNVLFIFSLFLFNKKNILNKFLKVFSFLALIIFILLTIISSPIINSDKYYKLIGDVQQYDYNKEKPDISKDLIPVVDYELAKKLGDKVLGKDIGLGSQFDIGEYYLVSTKDDLAWVAPLEPQNFFKWFQNKDSIPGYIYVSATNPNDIRLVQDINGKDINIKYSDESYFNHEINRYAYLQNNLTKGMTDYSFEIDDEGNPYWVITTYTPTIGFSGYDVSGIIVVDAQTGKTNYYNKDDKNIPSWVDRIYPKSFIYEQLKYYGSYKNGWINTITSQKEMIQPTEGLSYVFIDNKPYFYTGMTSIKSDQSTVGFIITDIVSKKTSFYTLNGSTETSAKLSAEGKVQQFDYTASAPILLDLYNTPTYFMTLKDKDGLVKQYAFVSVKNYNIVSIGDSINSSKKDYYDLLKNNGVLKTDSNSISSKSGTIERINQLDDIFYLKLKNDNNIYLIDKDSSKELVLTQVNDNVTLKFNNSDNTYKEVTEFENNSF